MTHERFKIQARIIHQLFPCLPSEVVDYDESVDIGPLPLTSEVSILHSLLSAVSSFDEEALAEWTRASARYSAIDVPGTGTATASGAADGVRFAVSPADHIDVDVVVTWSASTLTVRIEHRGEASRMLVGIESGQDLLLLIPFAAVRVQEYASVFGELTFSPTVRALRIRVVPMD